MKRQILLFSFLLVSIALTAQNITPEMLGFKGYTVKTDDLGTVNYYVSKNNDDTQKPLLVYLDGSGAFPLFQQTDRGLGSTVVINFQQLSKTYRILLISKPDVPFIDKVGRAANGFPEYAAPKGYKERLSFQWRVGAAQLALNDFLKKNEVDKSRIVALGFSEGSQIAAALANKEKSVTQLMLFSSNGLNQFYDPLITARMKAKSGQLTEEQAQKEVDSLFTEYRKIHADPKATDKEWWGHTYKRWSTFSKTAPVNNLYELKIPIYMANGSLDQNSVLSADYVNMVFMIQQKDNLTYKVYPNYDHQFNELHFENGQFKQAVPKLQEVFQDAFSWLAKQK